MGELLHFNLVLLPRLLVAEATEEVSSKVDVYVKRNTTRNSSVKLYKFIYYRSTRSAYSTVDSVNIINSDEVTNSADRLYRPASHKDYILTVSEFHTVETLSYIY